MIEYKRILHPTDMSDIANHAARYAVDFAERFQAELHILYVLDDSMGKLPSSLFPPPGSSLREMSPEDRSEMSAQLKTEISDEVRIVRATRMGPLDAEIVRYAEDGQMHLMVLGTHGRIGLSHLLLGSVAESVLRKAPCPVLTVRLPS